jgi:hypothetical protein
MTTRRREREQAGVISILFQNRAANDRDANAAAL